MRPNKALASAIDSISELWGWALRTVCRSLPDPVARAFERPVARMGQMTDDGRLVISGIRMRSLAGRERTRLDTSDDEALPLWVDMTGTRLFRRIVTVNAAILQRGPAAMAARLARHSPLPPDSSVLAYSVVHPVSPDRVAVEMFVTRRGDLDQARDAAAKRATTWRVIAGADDAERPVVELARAQRGFSIAPVGSLALSGAVLVVVLVVVLLASADRQERLLAQGVSDRASYLQRAERLRELTSLQTTLDELRGVEDVYPRVAFVLRLFERAGEASDIPDEVARMDLQPGGALRIYPAAAGAAPRDIVADPAVDGAAAE